LFNFAKKNTFVSQPVAARIEEIDSDQEEIQYDEDEDEQSKVIPSAARCISSVLIYR
jgi:hypothetical protein